MNYGDHRDKFSRQNSTLFYKLAENNQKNEKKILINTKKTHGNKLNNCVQECCGDN